MADLQGRLEPNREVMLRFSAQENAWLRTDELIIPTQEV